MIEDQVTTKSSAFEAHFINLDHSQHIRTCSAVKSSWAAWSNTKPLDALDGSILYYFVARETEVVVGGQVETLLAFDHEIFTGLRKSDIFEYFYIQIALKLVEALCNEYSQK